MRKILIPLFIFSALIIFFSLAVSAQTVNQIEPPAGTCEGPVYKTGELSQRAVLTSRPRANLTEEARANHIRGRVKLKAVLCRSGQVTDIKVIEGLPFGVTEQAVKAVRKIDFKPAEIQGQAVSQELDVEYVFSYVGEPGPIATGKLEGRMIDSITVEGYSENTRSKLNKCTVALEGNIYNKKLIERVWQCLLKLEDFDPKTSVVRIEESEMGGLGVVYLLQGRQKK